MGRINEDKENLVIQGEGFWEFPYLMGSILSVKIQDKWGSACISLKKDEKGLEQFNTKKR